MYASQLAFIPSAEYQEVVLAASGMAANSSNAVVGNGLSFLVGRVSYTFGLQARISLLTSVLQNAPAYQHSLLWLCGAGPLHKHRHGLQQLACGDPHGAQWCCQWRVGCWGGWRCECHAESDGELEKVHGGRVAIEAF